MAFRIFSIPISDSGTLQAEMNGFLRSHRILAIKQRWVEQGAQSLWCFCIDYSDPASSTASASSVGSGSRQRVDYRELLKPEEFAIFAQLRDWRKEVAQREAVPVYTIFTNEHLAQMVQTRVGSVADLKKIEGIGDARAEKYAVEVLAFLGKHWTPKNEASS